MWMKFLNLKFSCRHQPKNDHLSPIYKTPEAGFQRRSAWITRVVQAGGDNPVRRAREGAWVDKSWSGFLLQNLFGISGWLVVVALLYDHFSKKKILQTETVNPLWSGLRRLCLLLKKISFWKLPMTAAMSWIVAWPICDLILSVGGYLKPIWEIISRVQHQVWPL